jgi:hypothetical protein
MRGTVPPPSVVVQREQLEPRSAYSLRQARAQAGVPVKVISERLGHATTVLLTSH